MVLLERHDVLDDAPAEQPEVASVGGDLDLGDPRNHPVADLRDDPLDSGSPSRLRRCA